MNQRPLSTVALAAAIAEAAFIYGLPIGMNYAVQLTEGNACKYEQRIKNNKPCSS